MRAEVMRLKLTRADLEQLRLAIQYRYFDAVDEETDRRLIEKLDILLDNSPETSSICPTCGAESCFHEHA